MKRTKEHSLIDKKNGIDKKKLSEEFYLTSLIEEAHDCHLISQMEIEKIQLDVLELLAYKTKEYTKGKSSSVMVEVAQNIMKSNLYTMSLYLKTCSSPEDAVMVLKEMKISELYDLGRERIDIKLKTARYYHHLVIKSMIDVENDPYHSTLIGGIYGFFKRYNPDFSAHEIHITVDYPLYHPISTLVGIEFIQKYLESLKYENMFCQYFSAKGIQHLLFGYHEDVKVLIINLFEQVLSSAIASVFVKTEIRELTTSFDQIKALERRLSNHSKNEIEVMVLEAYDCLSKELEMTGSLFKHYIKKAMPKMAVTIFNAIKLQRLETVFVQPRSLENKPRLYFSFGEKMKDKSYRKLIDELKELRTSFDKIAMIQDKINSLGDLKDLFFDAGLKEDEIKELLSGLELVELAALAKGYPYQSEIKAIDLTESETAFYLCLNSYLRSLSKEKQFQIAKLIDLLDCEN